MFLPDLPHLEDSEADTVLAAVRQWCFEHGCDISDDDGKQAMAVAVRLVKSGGGGDTNLLEALSVAMAAAARPARVHMVLIVEDEPLIAMDMEAVLEAEGLSVEYCASRTDALKLLVSKTPLAAILDFHLKDGEATDIAAELKARNVPVIFCSGLHQSDIPLELRNAHWLHKPFDDRQLVDIVRGLLEMREFRQQTEQRA